MGKSLRIADIGCASGQLLRKIAERNPTAELVGVEIDASSVRQGNAFAVPNVTLYLQSDLPASKASDYFDVCIVTDVIHDATDPLAIFIEAFRLLKKPSGVFLIVEPRTRDSVEKQVKDAGSAFKYGVSLHGCLPSAMGADASGAGLGTLGLTTELVLSSARAAGFQSARLVPGTSADPFNSYYVCHTGSRARL